MSKKQVQKPKAEEIEDLPTPELVETRKIALDSQTLEEIKKYLDFMVKRELTPAKQELESIIEQLKTVTEHGIRLLDLKPADLRLTQKSEELSLPKFMQLDDIIALYSEGKISLGRAAELSKLKYDVLIDELLKKGVRLNLGPENIEEALEEERAFRETMKGS